MSRSVTIATGKVAILLPDGGTYDAGKTVIITDAQFKSIRPELIPGTIIDNGLVDDEAVARQAGDADGAVTTRRLAAAAKRRPLTTVPGRQWITRFEASQAAADDAQWTLTNLTRTVDGPRSCAKTTAPASTSSCLTKDRVRDVDVTVRFRIADVDATYHVGYANIAAHARYVDFSNRLSLDADFWHSYAFITAPSNLSAGLAAQVQSGFSPLPTNQVLTTTDQVNDRIMRIRAIGDIVLAKIWMANTPEPDWQFARMARETNSTAGDTVEAGFAGVEAVLAGTLIYEVVVIELLPGSELLVAGRLRQPDSVSGLPISSAVANGIVAGTSTMDMPTVIDPFGISRPVAHLLKPATGGGQGWQWRIHNARNRGRIYATRRSPEPFKPFPAQVRVSVWSKGANVVNPTPAGTNLGAACVLYYYDTVGATRNQITGEYYRALGPKERTASTVPVGSGTGTWDWFETAWVMPLYAFEDLLWTDVFVGLHDPGTMGELWVSDVSIEAV